MFLKKKDKSDKYGIPGKKIYKRIHQSLSDSRTNSAISDKTDQNIEHVKKAFNNDSSLISIKLNAPAEDSPKIGIVFLKGLTQESIISRLVIQYLEQHESGKDTGRQIRSKNPLEAAKKRLISSLSIKEISSMDKAINEILDGNTVVFIEASHLALVMSTAKPEKRNIEKPDLEASLIGSKEAFIEDVNTNKAMLRKRLSSTKLRFKSFRVGRISRSKVSVAWLDGIANPRIVEEALTRIEKIDIDCISSLGVFIELIEDNPLSLWPQYKASELPDVTASNLAEGRIAIICDGFPFAVIVPYVLMQDMQTPDDYGHKIITGSFLRITRYVALFFALLASPLYLSFVAYNHSVLPPDLANHISAGRERVPFPSAIEVIFMTIVIDLLREAGSRLPKSLGSTIGILGAVVIGQAAVMAGYVSSSVIIIISMSAISSFVIPSYVLATTVRIANYILIAMASVMGFFGVILGGFFLFCQILSLRSFGVLISYPSATGNIDNLGDLFRRVSVKNNRKRPEYIADNNQTRFGESGVDPENKGKKKRMGRK